MKYSAVEILISVSLHLLSIEIDGYPRKRLKS
jgi:hypothetical protein